MGNEPGYSSGNPLYFRFDWTFNADKSLEQVTYASSNGTTYDLVMGFKGKILAVEYTEQDTGGGYGVLASPITGTASFTVSWDVMTLIQDTDGNEVYDSSHPITGTYPGGGGGPTTDITLTLQKMP
jgi:hypothetical protein